RAAGPYLPPVARTPAGGGSGGGPGPPAARKVVVVCRGPGQCLTTGRALLAKPREQGSRFSVRGRAPETPWCPGAPAPQGRATLSWQYGETGIAATCNGDAGGGHGIPAIGEIPSSGRSWPVPTVSFSADFIAAARRRPDAV